MVVVEKVCQVCADILELFNIYSSNWFDVEGNSIPIDSVILKVVKDADRVNNDEKMLSDLYLFFTFNDLYEDTIYQKIGSDLTMEDIKYICDYSRSKLDCNLSVFSVQ